jgi:hypothetical protein
VEVSVLFFLVVLDAEFLFLKFGGKKQKVRLLFVIF